MLDENGQNWLTTKEASKIIGVSTRQVINMIKNGRLEGKSEDVKGVVWFVLESSARAAKRQRKPKQSKP